MTDQGSYSGTPHINYCLYNIINKNDSGFVGIIKLNQSFSKQFQKDTIILT